MLVFDSELANWAPYVDGRRHSLALIIAGGRYATAVARRDDAPVIVSAHAGAYDADADATIVGRLIAAAGRYACRTVWTTQWTVFDPQHPALRLDRVETLQRDEGPKGPRVDGRMLTPEPDARCPAEIDQTDDVLIHAVRVAAFVSSTDPRPLTPAEAEERSQALQRLRSAFW